MSNRERASYGAVLKMNRETGKDADEVVDHENGNRNGSQEPFPFPFTKKCLLPDTAKVTKSRQGNFCANDFCDFLSGPSPSVSSPLLSFFQKADNFPTTIMVRSRPELRYHAVRRVDVHGCACHIELNRATVARMSWATRSDQRLYTDVLTANRT